MDAADVPASVAKVMRTFADLGCPGPAVHYERDAVRTAELMAELETDPGAFATTSLFWVDQGSALVVNPGDSDPDPTALSSVLGTTTARLAPDWEARRLSGQDPGALAPVGLGADVQIVIDIALARYSTIWVPAGHVDYVYTTSYAELLRATAGIAAALGDLPKTDAASESD